MAFRVDARIVVGATTINLSGYPAGGSSCALLGWVPGRAKGDVIGLPETIPEGEPVPERLTIDVVGASYAASAAVVVAIEAALAQGELYRQRQMGDIPYLEVRTDGAGSWYRSPILGGSAAYEDGLYKYQAISGVVRLELTVLRMYYWEASTETTLSLTNRNGTATDLIAWNYYISSTGGRDNFVTIAAGSVLGDLPSPPTIRVTDVTASGSNIADVYVNHSHLTPSLGGSILQGTASSFGTNVGAAGSSSGTVKRANIASDLSDTVCYQWTVSGATLAAYAGIPCDLIAVFKTNGPTADLNLKARILYVGSTLWESDWMPGNAAYDLMEFGSVRIPPYRAGSTSLEAITLQIVGRLVPGAAAVDIDLDQLNLFPRVWFRRFRRGGAYMPAGYALTDDPSGNLTYVADTSGNNRTAFYVASGQIYLMPGAEQRLYFFHQIATSGAVDIQRQMRIQVRYRPRFSTIWG